MGAPVGNKNASAKNREFRDSIKWVMETYENSAIERGQALREVAKTLLEKALEGDMTAIKEIGDRIDGKPQQAIEGSGSMIVMLNGSDAGL